MTPVTFRSACRGVVLLSLVGLLGCGKPKGDVTGTVQFGGQRITSGTVTLMDAKGATHQCEITPTGTYTLKGVHPGLGKFIVVSVNARMLEDVKALSAGGRGGRGQGLVTNSPRIDPSRWHNIPERYGDFNQSDLSFEVQKGANTYDLVLR